MPKASQKIEVTQDTIWEVKKNNPSDMQVIELEVKKSDFYWDQFLIAGYLNECLNTENLWTLITSLISLFEKYVKLQLNDWTSAPIPNPTDAENPVASSLFLFLDQLSSNIAAAEFLNHAHIKPHLQKLAAVFSSADSKQLLAITGHIITTNILIKVIHAASKHFEKLYEFN